MTKFTKIATAVAALCGAVSAQAYDPGVLSTDYRVVISGATAPTTTVRDIILRDICGADKDFYNYPAGTVRYTIACTTTAGKRVQFMKNDGGSGTGVAPVDQGIPVSVLELPSNTACGVGSTASAFGGVGPAFISHNCGSTNGGLLANRTPDFGISDIEPSKFVQALAPTEGSFINAGNMKVSATSGLAFGILVSKNLYQALQKAQFADTNNCSPVVGTGGVDTTPANGIEDAYEAQATNAVGTLSAAALANHRFGDTEACMPTLSTATVRSLLLLGTDGIENWTELKAKGTDLVALNSTEVWGTADPTKYLCRRTTGSGTHAVTAIKFLQTQCGAGSSSGSSIMPNGTLFTSTECGSSVCDTVMEGVGSGNLLTCVDTVNDSGVWGVGYASLESNATLAADARFVKIDGAAPTLANMVAGKYPIFGEITAQSRQQDNSAFYTPANVPAVGTNLADAKANWATIVAELTSKANVIQQNASGTFRHPFGNSGFLARGTPTVFKYNPATPDPVATQTHVNPAGGVQNTCFGPVSSVPGINVE
jgi:hypothetical protein